MDKRKSLLIIALLIGLITIGYSQKLNFNSDKRVTYALNQEVANALNSNNSSKLDRLLTKDPNSVNCGVGQNCPLLYKAVELCLSNQVSTEMVKVVLKHHPNYYCLYNKESPFYCILRYLATHTISTCGTAESLFYQFYNLPDFNVLEVFDMTPPPLAFLLNTNHEYLKGRFDHNYINSDIVIALVERGASVNSRDRNSSTLMAYATECRNQTLIDYCLGKNVDLNVKNKQGVDPFCVAVRDDQLSTVKKLLKSGYSLTEDRIANTALKTIMPSASQEVAGVCFDVVKSGVKNLSALQILRQAFPKNFVYYITDGYNRSNLNVPTSELPSLIQLFDNIKDNTIAQTNLTSLKTEYVHSASNLDEFGKFLKSYPIYSFEYSKDYYKNENDYKKLTNSLRAIQNKLPSSLYNKLMAEASQKVSSFINDNKDDIDGYVGIINGYKSYLQENPAKYKEIEEKAYQQCIKTIWFPNYTYQDYYVSIQRAIRQADRDISTCNKFISYFTNSNYIEDAKSRREKSKDVLSKLKSIVSASEDYYKRLRSKYEEYKQYILNYGKTPSYSIEGNGDKLIITVNHYSSYSFVGRGFLSDDKIDYSLEYENGRYEIRRILLLGKGDRHRSEQLSKAVREAVFYDFCEGDNYIMRVYDNNDSYYYRFREAVNYLSKYYKSEWWVWPFGNPIYKMD
jgi:hypothetical protein